MTIVTQLVDVSVHRGGKQVLDGISLSIFSGRVPAPSAGEIDFGGHDLEVGVVHQEPLLFPWLTVRENRRERKAR